MQAMVSIDGLAVLIYKVKGQGWFGTRRNKKINKRLRGVPLCRLKVVPVFDQYVQLRDHPVTANSPVSAPNAAPNVLVASSL